MNLLKAALIIGCLGLLASPCLAQGHIDCAAFRRNLDETWSPLRNVRIKGPDRTLDAEAGLSFHRGVPFAGIDVAAVLEAECR